MHAQASRRMGIASGQLQRHHPGSLASAPKSQTGRAWEPGPAPDPSAVAVLASPNRRHAQRRTASARGYWFGRFERAGGGRTSTLNMLTPAQPAALAFSLILLVV